MSNYLALDCIPRQIKNSAPSLVGLSYMIKEFFFLFFFFFLSLSPFRAVKGRRGNAAQKKPLVSRFVVSSPYQAPPSLPRRRLSHKIKKATAWSAFAARAYWEEKIKSYISALVRRTLWCIYAKPGAATTIPSSSCKQGLHSTQFNSSLLLSFGRSPRLCKTRRLLCLRIFICLFVCFLKRTLVRREMPPNLSVLGGESTFPVMIHGLAQDHSSRFSSQRSLFTKSSNRCA